ncbi:uncharacterized protein CBL_01171 [Carabus blaptoides fortunei]
MTDIQARLLDEKLRRALRAKMRFKATVRQVIQNAPWLAGDVDDVDLDNLKRNAPILSRKVKMARGLTIQDKAVLRKQPEYRTDEEKNHLFNVIGGIKCFRCYARDIRYQLASVTYFEFYDKGRVLVRQGQEAHAMYFLLAGEISIRRKVYDEVSEEWTDKELGTMKNGDFFGDISLLHDVPRTATIVSIVACELLCLKKDDFDRILKDTVKKQWLEMQESMAKIPYFNDWDIATLRECCIYSKIKHYEKDTVILGDDAKQPSSIMIYFVVKGRCSIIEHLFITEYVQNGIKHYELYKHPKDEYNNKFANRRRIDDNDSDYVMSTARRKYVRKPSLKYGSLPPNVKIRFMQIATITEKGQFKEGKLFKNRRIIAQTPVTCLLIPSFWLEQHNKANIWERIYRHLEFRIPTTEKVFQSYVKNKKWLEYRTKMLHKVLSEKQYPNNTTILDVPYSLRILHEID